MFTTYHIDDFPSDHAIKGQFMLERFEKLQRPPNLQWPHKHSFYEIQWLTSGQSTNVIDYHQTIVAPETLFFISPGQLHQMSSAPKVKGYSITFTEAFLLLTGNDKERLLALSFLDNSYDVPYLKLTKKAIEELRPVLKLLEEEVLLSKKSPAIIGNLLFVLLHKIQRIIDSKRKPSDPANVIRFKTFRQNIEEFYKKEKGLDFYAVNIGITVHRLNEICKLVSGKTAGEIVRERLLLESKRLLIHSDMSIQQISDELGYEDLSYFSRQFRKNESMTPSAYRKEMYEKYQSI
jgi:AraC-like DNA-binding protein